MSDFCCCFRVVFSSIGLEIYYERYKNCILFYSNVWIFDEINTTAFSFLTNFPSFSYEKKIEKQKKIARNRSANKEKAAASRFRDLKSCHMLPQHDLTVHMIFYELHQLFINPAQFCVRQRENCKRNKNKIVTRFAWKISMP